MSRGRLLLLALLMAAVAAFFAFDLGRLLNLEAFKSQQAAIEAWRAARPAAAAAIYFLLYVAVAALSLPGAAVMTLAGGAVFGFGWGFVLVSFASSAGATLAFLASRFLFRDAIRARFGARLDAIDRGMARDGAFYLFALRLVPVFPFFLVNLLMGLTPIRAWTFYWVSQVGMLAGTAVYVNAGTQLARVDSLAGLLSPALLGSFALLGLFPLAARKALALAQARKVYAGWTRPAKFDCNLAVIGAGSAGLVSAYIAAAVKAKVVLIERHRMGGDCLNTGCVPSKALIRSAKFLSHVKRSADWGIARASAEFDFGAVMARVRRVVAQIEPHDSVERYTALGVDVVRGEAKLLSPWELEVRGADGGMRRIAARSIIIAAGGRPFVPPIPGIDAVEPLTSDSLWDLQELPKRLLVLGGGPIGCELAQCFARLGSKVTQVEALPRLLTREDPEIAALVEQRFRAEGIELRTGTRAKAFVVEDGERALIAEAAGAEIRIPFDRVLVAVGRRANTSGYGLETLGIPLTSAGTIEVNDSLQTRYPNIYACGDVAGPYQFTHTAAHMAWYAAVNALFGRWRRFRVDWRVVPWATFTEPEVARVGLNETEAKERNIPHEVTTYGIDDLDRAIADGEAHGLVKVLTAPGSDRLLGVTIAGEHAGDLIAEYVQAMKQGIGLNAILGTIHIYPTLAEANKYAAGAWKRAHAPKRLLAWIEKYHAWQRR